VASETPARIIATFADAAVEHAAKEVIRGLQRLRNTPMLGGDSVLKNTWDEICVQVQYEESLCWDAYNDIARTFIDGALHRLSPQELHAIWLQTEAGFNWFGEHDLDAEIPFCRDDVVEHVLRALHNHAANWSNERIRVYLER